jgi:hypothetical protein
LVESIASADAITGKAACALGLPSPLYPAKGQQLVLAQLGDDTAAGLPQCNDDISSSNSCDDYAAPSIVVGDVGHPWPTQEADAAVRGQGGGILVASVAPGTAPELQMNDGGRAQDLNLRTGERTREASALYYPVPYQDDLASNTNAPDYLFNPPGVDYDKIPWGQIELSLTGGWALLAPYYEPQGWAPPGHAWLVVDLNLAISSAEGAAVKYSGDIARSFTLTISGGAVLPGSGNESYLTPVVSKTSDVGAETAAGTTGTADLIFEVPASLTRYVLAYTPVGMYTNQWSGHSIALAGGRLQSPSDGIALTFPESQDEASYNSY